jgi:hypothetical protein
MRGPPGSRGDRAGAATSARVGSDFEVMPAPPLPCGAARPHGPPPSMIPILSVAGGGGVGWGIRPRPRGSAALSLRWGCSRTAPAWVGLSATAQLPQGHRQEPNERGNWLAGTRKGSRGVQFAGRVDFLRKAGTWSPRPTGEGTRWSLPRSAEERGGRGSHGCRASLACRGSFGGLTAARAAGSTL